MQNKRNTKVGIVVEQNTGKDFEIKRLSKLVSLIFPLGSNNHAGRLLQKQHLPPFKTMHLKTAPNKL